MLGIRKCYWVMALHCISSRFSAKFQSFSLHCIGKRIFHRTLELDFSGVYLLVYLYIYVHSWWNTFSSSSSSFSSSKPKDNLKNSTNFRHFVEVYLNLFVASHAWNIPKIVSVLTHSRVIKACKQKYSHQVFVLWRFDFKRCGNKAFMLKLIEPFQWFMANTWRWCVFVYKHQKQNFRYFNRIQTQII